MRRSTPDHLGRSVRPRSRFAGRAVLLLFVLSTFGGLFAAVQPPAANADALSDAYRRQQALQKLIAKQQASIRSLTASQAVLSTRIAGTKQSLSQINANLTSVKTQIVAMVVDVARSQNAVDELNATARQLDAELAQIEADELSKQAQLSASIELLASRIREAYDKDRTSMIETMLSSADFTDALTEVGYQLDFAAQDKLLADQITQDKQTLAVIHQNVAIAKQQTLDLHAEASKAKATLDAQLKDLKDARAELAALEAETARLLQEQQDGYARISADKAKLAAQLAAQKKADAELERLIARLVQEALAKGGIPSVYNGTFIWPVRGRITQEFGCTGFYLEPSYGSCSHFHRGIDIAAPMYTPIYAAGPGKVIFAGRSPNSTLWYVIIAHSSHLVSWYAHVDNGSHRPRVRVGQYVTKGQLIAYVGMTGMTTGPHTHWAVQLNGNWVNPRLFLPR